MDKKDKIYELIVKDLTSEISEEEKAELHNEIHTNSFLKRKYLVIREFWTKFYPKSRPNQIIEKTEKKLGFTYHHYSTTRTNLLLKIAASLLLIISLSFTGYHLFKPKKELVLNEYECGPNEIKKITLTDGTKVWLNSTSLLIASEPFTGKNREVKLFGEGYFEVASNLEQPFIVKTRNLSTKVLGTHFNVVAHPTDEVHEISLYEGKVKLMVENQQNSNVILQPGDKAYYNVQQGKLSVKHTDLGKPARWRDGVLRFYDEDLFSITKKLERNFKTRIFIADSLVGKLRFTAEFDIEPLDKILDLLKEAQDFDYQKTENGIIIKTTNK